MIDTYSMKPNEKFVHQIIPKMLDEFRKQFPSSRFGLISFNDEDTSCRDYLPAHNYGVRIQIPLEESSKNLASAATNFKALYGGDARSEEE